MEKLKKAGVTGYCIGLMGMVSPQFFYKTFCINFFPPWPGLPLVNIWVYLFTIITVLASITILFGKRQRITSLFLGSLLLAIYIFGYLPYELFVAKYNNHLGTWANGLKETALAGGAFAVAGSFPAKANTQSSPFLKFLEKLIPYGPFLFCLTMILYGVSHFLYGQYIAPMVPGWLPGSQIFWTYFAGAALIGSGITITLRIQVRMAALLLGSMIFLWLFMIHIPRSIADPFGNNANEPVSAFSALAFIGIALVIACGNSRNPVEYLITDVN